MSGLDFVTGSLLSEDVLHQLAQSPELTRSRHGPEQDIDKLLQLSSDAVFSARAPAVSAGYQTASFNLLSTLLTACARSSRSDVLSHLWEGGLWEAAFRTLSIRAADSLTKPARQLLQACTLTLRDVGMSSDSANVRASTLQDLLRRLYIAMPAYDTKCVMQSLALLLSKKAVSFDHIRDAAAEHIAVPMDPVTALDSLVTRTLSICTDQDLTSAAAPFLASLSISFDDSSAHLASSSPSGAKLVATVLVKHYLTNAQDRTTMTGHLFPALFHRDFTLCAMLIDNVLQDHRNVSPNAESRETAGDMLPCLLAAANKHGWVSVNDNAHAIVIDIAQRSIQVPLGYVRRLVCSDVIDSRIHGCHLLLSTRSAGVPFSRATLKLLRQLLPVLHADCDAHFRSEIHSLTEKLFDRLRTSMAVTRRKHAEHPAHHQEFGLWYAEFLSLELRSSASYQRHICAMTSLHTLYDSMLLASHDEFWHSQGLRTLLLDLTIDPFDDIRALAADMIRKIVSSKGFLRAEQSGRRIWAHDVYKALSVAKTLAIQSAREDHSDCLAHLYALLPVHSSMSEARQTEWSPLQSLLSELKRDLDVLEINRIQMLHSLPLHGQITGLRYALGARCAVNSQRNGLSDTALTDSLVTLIHRVWRLSAPVLCNDAPEGHVPDDVDGEESIDTKTILSYAWRAVQEASLLARALLSQDPKTLASRLHIDELHIEQLCSSTLDQLHSLRHRGAFTTVAQTFIIGCKQLSLSSSKSDTILRGYLQGALENVRGGAVINTRRSAGLPSIFIAILAAEDSCKSDIFSLAYSELVDIASASGDEDHEAMPHIHALNCLKDIFKNPRFVQRTEAYLAPMVTLAGQCLTSNVWGVRNSGLMLFRILLDRLFGNYTANNLDKIVNTSISALSKVPHLGQLALDLLANSLRTSEETSSIDAEGVFPALQVLQRLARTNALPEQAEDTVTRYLQSTQWQLRDQAARTLAVLITPSKRSGTISTTLRTHSRGQNHHHGCLLLCKHLLRHEYTYTIGELQEIYDSLCAAAATLYYDNACAYTMAAFMDIQIQLRQGMMRNGLWPRDTTLPDPITELREIMRYTSSEGSSGASFRHSLAMAVAYYCSEEADSVSLYSELARVDPDACVDSLLTAADAVTRGEAQNMVAVFLRICDQLLKDAKTHLQRDTNLMLAVHKLLAILLCHIGEEDVLRAYSQCHFNLIQHGNSPLSHYGALECTGALLHASVVAEQFASESKETIVATWISRLRSACDDLNSVDARLAAARSIVATQQSVHALLRYVDEKTRVSLLVVIYDLTNDDDETVRVLGANIVDEVLRHETDGVKTEVSLPLIAGGKLLRYLVKRYRSSSNLAQVAFDRLYVHSANKVQPVSESATNGNTGHATVLFAEEKQNLFIDEAREARIWSQVLLKLSPTALNASLVSQWFTETMENLDFLIVRAKSEQDGPLCWARNADAFVRGLKIIYASQVLLEIRHRARHAAVPGVKMRTKLVELYQGISERDVHPLWKVQLEKLLVRRIRGGLRNVSRVLTSIGKNIDT